MRQPLARVLALVLTVCVALVALMPAMAQEVVDKTRVWHKTDGVYDITVIMTPAEPEFWVAHYDVAVLDAATRQPVAADVKILATGPGAKSAGWAVAMPTGKQGVYGADVNLDKAGTWDVSVNVNGSKGADFVSLSIAVPEVQRTDMGLVVFALVLLFFAFGVWTLWREGRKARRQRLAAPDAMAPGSGGAS